MTIDEALRLIEIRRLAAEGEAREIRERARLSLRECAELIDVDVSQLSRWETGKSAPKRAAALRWLTLLEMLKKTRATAEAEAS
jgi:DNA-binding transcriptional regulator YiaG